jgi:hypothetical protein
MPELHSTPTIHCLTSGQLREALDRLEGLVVDGLKHGYFNYSIVCEMVTGGRRELVIRPHRPHRPPMRSNRLCRWSAVWLAVRMKRTAQPSAHTRCNPDLWLMRTVRTISNRPTPEWKIRDGGHGCERC